MLCLSLVILNANLVSLTHDSCHAARVEDNANSFFFAPNHMTTSSEVICGDYEIKYRRNANLVRDLQGGTGVRKISNEAIDTCAVELDRSSLQNPPTEPVSFVVHRALSIQSLGSSMMFKPPRMQRCTATKVAR